jgi:hypothetical protein
MINKTAAQKIAAVLTEVPGTLRKLAEERRYWRDRALKAEGEHTKLAQRERIEKLATEMQRKGLDASRTTADCISLLEKKAAEGRLDVIEEAVGMSPTGRPFGELMDDMPGNARNELEQYILEGLG